jgi:hypothetical protein
MNPIQSLLKRVMPITGALADKVKINPIAMVHTRAQISSRLSLRLKKLAWFICAVVKKQAISRSVMEATLSKISQWC